MKKLIFLILAIIMMACTEKTPQTECSISGVSLNNPDEFMFLFEGRNTDTISLNEDGSFLLLKDIEKAGTYYLRSGKEYISLYLAPGYDLVVNFDMENLIESLSFEGSLAFENEYKQKAVTLSRELSKIRQELYTASPDDYKAGILSHRNKKDSLLNEFYKENPEMCKVFVKNEKLDQEFSYYNSLLNYERLYKYYAKVEEVELPDNWYSFLDDITIDNPDYLNVPICLRVINTIIDHKVKEETGLGDDDDEVELLEARIKCITENLESHELINYFLNSCLGSHIDGSGTAGIEKAITAFYEKSTNEEDIETIKEKVANWAPLAAGMPAPEFSLPDIEGNIVSLADFKGKYVYIDFWATWCSPCRTEIPFLEKLSEDYKDKNIKIISISVDRDIQSWIDMVTKDQPQWLQLHDSIKMNDDYLVKYIPSFILIDKEGKMIEARTLRPSSGEKLEELLNSLEGI